MDPTCLQEKLILDLPMELTMIPSGTAAIGYKAPNNRFHGARAGAGFFSEILHKSKFVTS